MRPRAAAWLVLLLALPLAGGQSSSAMVLVGPATLNGAPAPGGTPVEVWSEGRLVATGLVDDEGRLYARVAADDPATPEREGAREGAELVLRAFGGASVSGGVRFEPAFEPREVRPSFVVPDLVLSDAGATPAQAPEGVDVRLSGIVVNRGARTAESLAVEVRAGDATVRRLALGSLAPGAASPFEVVVGTAGLGGVRALRVHALSAAGEAQPADNEAIVRVEVLPNAPPRFERLALEPAAPRAGEPVRLVADVADEDGVRAVRLVWSVDGRTHVLDRAAPPYEAILGPFPAGTVLAYGAEAVDAGPAAKSTNATMRTVTVAAQAPPRTAPAPAPSAGVPAPVLALALAGVGGAAALLVVGALRAKP